MAEDTDFSTLYDTLELTPACSLAQLRLAYRRRVAVLHPDRNEGDTAALQRLNTLYAAALEFQRRNGRLPGAPVRGNVPMRSMASPPPAAASGYSSTETPDRDGSTRMRSIALLLLALLVVALVWTLANSQPAPAPTPSTGTSATAEIPAAASSGKQQLWLGMDATAVRDIEGDPVTNSATHWEYGPSWIAFHCGHVSGWYSSPFWPLHVATAQREPAANPPRCKAKYGD